MKRHAEALSAWRNATLQKPTHVQAWANMLLLLDNLERFDDVDVVIGNHSGSGFGTSYGKGGNALFSTVFTLIESRTNCLGFITKRIIFTRL